MTTLTNYKVNDGGVVKDLGEVFDTLTQSSNLLQVTSSSTSVLTESRVSGEWTYHVVYRHSNDPDISGLIYFDLTDNVVPEHEFTILCVGGGAGGDRDNDNKDLHGGGGGGQARGTVTTTAQASYFASGTRMTVNIGWGGVGGTTSNEPTDGTATSVKIRINEVDTFIISGSGGVASSATDATGTLYTEYLTPDADGFRSGGRGGINNDTGPTPSGSVATPFLFPFPAIDETTVIVNGEVVAVENNHLTGVYSGGGGSSRRATSDSKYAATAGGWSLNANSTDPAYIVDYGVAGATGGQSTSNEFVSAATIGAGGGAGGKKNGAPGYGGAGGPGLFICYYKTTVTTETTGPATNMLYDGRDLNQLFRPYTSGDPQAAATGFMVNGTDLNALFRGVAP